MLSTTIQGLIAHRFRLFATALAVTLGVAFTTGTFILTDTISRTFDGIMGDVYADTDAVVRGEEHFAGVQNTGAQRPRVDAALVDVIRSVDGVGAVSGSVTGYARIVAEDGTALGDPNQGAPTLGFSWPQDEQLNPFTLKAGRAPQSDDEAVIDVNSLDKAGLSIGDTATVLVQTGPQQVEIVGTIGFGSTSTIGGATMVAFPTPVAQRLMAEPGTFDEISVRSSDGLSQEALVERIAPLLPDDTEAVTGAVVTKESQDFTQEAMSFFRTFMLTFAVVALFVGTFMIYNTFSITVAQRTRENGLLRALGASRRQVLGSVVLEAIAVGLLASALGIVVGFGIAAGLKALLDALDFGIPAGGLVFLPRTAVVALAAGLGVTVVAAVLPARKAAKVAPIAAMSSEVVGSTGYGSKTRMTVGTLLLGAGATSLLLGLFTDVWEPVRLISFGAMGVFFGVIALGRTIALPLSRVIGAPLPRLRGLTGELARENAMRNPKRTATAASALMIGVMLVGVISIFVSSSKASIEALVDQAFKGDLVVTSGASLNGGLDPSVAPRLAALPEVESATGLQMGMAEVDGTVDVVVAVDPATAFEVMDVQPIAGRTDDLGVDAIAVHKDTADSKGLKIGDTLPVVFKDTGEQTMRVALIYGEDRAFSPEDMPYFFGKAAYSANVTSPYDYQVYVSAAAGSSAAQLRQAVDSVMAGYPGAEVLDRGEYSDTITAQFDPLLNLVFALLGLAIVIALLGIGNTLALSIVERTRELGLLRAVGMTRKQLRASVRWESVIIAIQGTLLGLVMAIVLGWAFMTALRDEGLEVFAVPTGTLSVIVLLGGLAGMLAAVLPSRRAARLDILKAVVSE